MPRIRKRIQAEHHHKKYRIKQKLTLKRNLGLLAATSAGVGIISGAGIYALVGVATNMAGNAVWLSFLISSLVAVFTGLSYAELSSIFPKDAGEYVYSEHAFGKRLAFMVGWLILISGIISVTVIALGFGGYFQAMFNIPQLGIPIISNPIIIVGIVLLGLIAFINFYGMKESSWLNIVFTCIEVGGLLIIIASGILRGRVVDYMAMPNGIEGVFSAAALIFFAFIGFESVIKLSEETKNPERTIPLALVLSIAITTCLYIGVAIAGVSVLGWEKIGASSAPLAEVARAAWGNGVFKLLAVIAMFSTANTVMISVMSTSRIAYGMGVEGSLPKILGRIHPKRMTPAIAIGVSVAISGLLLFWDKIQIFAEMTNLVIFLTFICVNLALLVLRYKEPDMPRKFRTPLNIGKFSLTPVLGILTCLFLITRMELIIIWGGVIFLLIGFCFYLWYQFGKKVKKVGWTGKKKC
jgi:APA family basic amino acid/polyamine antiporter